MTEQSSITGSVFYRTSKSEDETDNTNQRFVSNQLNSETFRTEDENEDDDNYQFSLNYVNDFDDNGQKLTVTCSVE